MKNVDTSKPLSKQSESQFAVYQPMLSEMHSELTQLGQKLLDEGKIKMNWGDSYARAALDHVKRQNGMS